MRASKDGLRLGSTGSASSGTKYDFPTFTGAGSIRPSLAILLSVQRLGGGSNLTAAHAISVICLLIFIQSLIKPLAGLFVLLRANGLVVGLPELHAIGAARLLASGSPGSAAGRAVEVVGYVGRVFWQAHGAGAGCHEVSQKAEPRSVAGLRLSIFPSGKFVPSGGRFC